MARLLPRLLTAGAAAALVLALSQPAAMAAAVPADTATPAPVTDLAGGYNTATFGFTMTWTVPDGNWGSRICGIEGTTAVTSADCTGADMALNIAGTGPQSLDVYKNLDNGQQNGFKAPFTITVWGLGGPWPTNAGGTDPAVSDPLTQTRLAAKFAGSTITQATVRYGQNYTFTNVLTGTADGQPLGGQPVDAMVCANDCDRATLAAHLTTKASGSVGYTLRSVTSQTTLNLAFTGGTSYYLAFSIVIVKPTAWGTIATTATSAKAGSSIGVYGAYTYSDTTGSAQLQVEKGSVWQKAGSAVTIKKQKLPNGVTRVGYVAHATEKTKGEYHFRVVMKSAHASFTSKAVALTFR